MPLKLTLNTEQYNALSDDLKTEYTMQPDLSYKLSLEAGVFTTDRDPANLMSALEAEREETRKAKAAANRLEKAAKDAERAKLTDVEAIRASYEKDLADERKKLEDERAEEKDRVKKAQAHSAEQMKKSKALELASSLFGTNAAILLPHVEAMIKAVPGDSPTLQIIDPITGIATLDQDFGNFKKSLSTNPTFAPMVVVTKASGGSANDGRSKGLPASTTTEGKPKTYRDYTPGELLEIKNSDPDLFKELRSNRG